jgi:hypothetical protein
VVNLVSDRGSNPRASTFEPVQHDLGESEKALLFRFAPDTQAQDETPVHTPHAFMAVMQSNGALRNSKAWQRASIHYLSLAAFTILRALP